MFVGKILVTPINKLAATNKAQGIYGHILDRVQQIYCA